MEKYFYRYRIWCPYCCGEDPYGCFDGDYVISEILYNTPEEAERAAEKRVGNSIWQYDIVRVDAEGKTVDKRQANYLRPWNPWRDNKEWPECQNEEYREMDICVGCNKCGWFTEEEWNSRKL